MQRKFFKTHHNISIGNKATVIDKLLFSDSEWRTSFLVKEITAQKQLLGECEEEIADDRPCTETKFEPSVGMHQSDPQTKELDLL